MVELRDLLGRLLPSDISFSAGPVDDHTAELFPLERLEIAKAVGRRRNEFSSGRVHARAALAALGCLPCAIGRGSDRRPLWPDGFVGSICHSDLLCAAVAGRMDRYAGIGIDIDVDEAVNAPIRETICRADEHNGFVQVEGRSIDATKLIFVVKEALFKAYYPATRNFLDFHDVRIAIAAHTGVFQAEIVRSTAPGLAGRRHYGGRFSWISNHLVAAVAIMHDETT